MYSARLRQCRVVARAGPFAQRAPDRRSLSSSLIAGNAKSKKTVFNAADLPRHKLDVKGRPVAPLGAWSDDAGLFASTNVNHKAYKSSTAPSMNTDEKDSVLTPDAEHSQLHAAIAAGIIPDSPLSREVYVNWLRFPDCILLTRVGKFYESYFEPARQLSSILNIKLAQKTYKTEKKFPFAGFPVAALDKYLKILVQELGHTVVIVEEFDEEGSIAYVGKKITAATGPKERRVYRVVTPGTMVDEGWMDGNESRYLLAIAMDNQVTEEAGEKTSKISLAYTDPSTGEFFTKETTMSNMEDELARITPREVVLDRSLQSAWQSNSSPPNPNLINGSSIADLFNLLQVLGVHVSFADPFRPPPLWATNILPSDITDRPRTTENVAIALLRHHLQYALRESMPTLAQPSRQLSESQMQIDAATLQALEIRHALRPGGLVATGDRQTVSPISSRGTLLSVISKTVTQSGHRLLIRTLTSPSTDLDMIKTRLALVQALFDREDLREELRDTLRGVEDVMRIIQRFKSSRGSSRDIWDAGVWIRTVEGILARIGQELKYEKQDAKVGAPSHSAKRLEDYVNGFVPIGDLAERIETSIDENAIMWSPNPEEIEDGTEDPGEAMVSEEDSKSDSKEAKETKKDRIERERQEKEDRQWWILPSFSLELERLHADLANLKKEKDKLQADLVKRYNTPRLSLVKSLRYGYHIQMTASEAAKVEKARSLERIGGSSGKTVYFAHSGWSALGAKTEIAMETLSIAQRRAERELRNLVTEQAEKIQRNAGLVDELDLTMCFAQNAREMGWVRPQLDTSSELDIVAGRHPSIESSLLQSSRTFTPNDTLMTPSNHLHVITGPNQGGKSTLLRQTAVIAILAQSGSFVPARRARIGIVDKVFSRIGARDDLWRDRSTFMLEMVETAAILKHATPRSLVIMDEIGRGTTLQAGVSIAYSTLNYILDNIGCRTMFATHYHELGRMLGYEDETEDDTRNAGRSAARLGRKGRKGVEYWCTDVDEVDGAFSYSYKLKPGINHSSHAIKAARLAGMPESFLHTAEDTLKRVQQTGRFDPPSIPSS
ncbi:uncharacterized protein I303_100616 [Kwoniella dejecticola CBS 10117]|uniref:DNA mismatch repair proteins mutS family domain-containing protein n=1 Tax=Kwoniella dejecticola CBS 10117 TaxID=1296121 RepID=A0A1A6AFE9_9TREE|nr:uncharacterized protein I303_00619 [Kwoniella dejecticola CBS 10117]OBR88802.1 hypothetical protein I303_00619 [Kwoniella dejecticola CBS 10117]